MIRYFNEDIDFVLKDKLLNNRWLKLVAGSEIRSIGDVNIIFCSDKYILDINIRYPCSRRRPCPAAGNARR